MTEKRKLFPEPIETKKMLGPSFLVLAMGLGSGEIILWPYLVANYGLGIAWGALLGISLQFFINMEIERYALVKGESVFVGLFRLFKWTPYWFICSTFLGFGLPGIVAASAKMLGFVFGVEDFRLIATGMLVLIGALLTFGKTVYETMEKATKILLGICVPFIFILTLLITNKLGWSNLFVGLIGKGEGYWFLPTGISLATFLAAFAYSGAGGNLNLTQSIYIKEKGYGMGKYSQKIAGLFRVKGHQEVDLEGSDFEVNEGNMKNLRTWWKRVNMEHFLIFWFVGLLSMLLLMTLSYMTAYGNGSNIEGINFVLKEGVQVGLMMGESWGIVLLLVLSTLLFQTQLGIVDSTSRIMGESLALIQQKKNNEKKVNLRGFYFSFVWLQILFGILMFALNIYEPKTLIVLGAVINAFAMLTHTILVYLLNMRTLKEIFPPNNFRRIAIYMCILFFSFFGLINLWGIFVK